MYGYAQEWGSQGERTLYPFILTDEDGAKELYLAEWGSDDESHVTLRFALRPLQAGQLVDRTDIIDGQPLQSVYHIERILSLLD
tara:strand:- start:10548 stop:10799 length:252 start_codon:yes stop_codon:yes gene_type:complete